MGPARARTPPLTVRLVKGAYWDHELVQARQHGWPAPVFEDKAECDRNFETLTRELLAARPARPGRDRLAQPAFGGACHCGQPRVAAATTATSSCRCCAGSATSFSTPSRRAATGSGPTARSATWSRGWPIWCAACSRTPATSLPARAGAGVPLERAAGGSLISLTRAGSPGRARARSRPRPARSSASCARTLARCRCATAAIMQSTSPRGSHARGAAKAVDPCGAVEVDGRVEREQL